jgi:hypothetical protein
MVFARHKEVFRKWFVCSVVPPLNRSPAKAESAAGASIFPASA